MDDATRERVTQRSGGRCEYCGIPQAYFAQRFQVEHIIARSHRGQDDLNNLAVACRRCNLHKGPNLSGLDPSTDELTRLFDPRKDTWSDHFTLLETGELVGLTGVGRTTVEVLAMNAQNRVELRMEIAALEAGAS